MTAHQSITSKSCGKCGEIKPIAEFWIDRGARRRFCRACDCRRQNARRAAKKSRPEAQEVSVDRVHADPSSWLRPGDTLMAGGYDFAWCYVVFKDVAEYPGYCVGSNGTVWSKNSFWVSGADRWKQLKATYSRAHLSLHLCNDSGHKTKWVHRLVLEAFVGPCPRGKEACHFPDRDPSNNHLWNLRWDTKKANSHDSKLHGTNREGIRNANAKLCENDVVEMRREANSGVSTRELARKYGLHRETVRCTIKRENWKHVP